ncbi:TIGR02391 family protein [Streptomyces antibioticus]|uniref:TIGR02391 family protein n=1 Tax=Streptomyces antibioticus TaxID=1890 RepID=UPI0033BDC9F4
MDRHWMCQRLEAFDALLVKYAASAHGPLLMRRDHMLRREMHRAEPTIQKILECIDPQLKIDFATSPSLRALYHARVTIKTALGICEDMENWKTRLAPDSPYLIADQLHPWVWDAARTLWESKHYRAAVHAAATSINARLQNKLGRRDLSDAKLVQEALSDKTPEPGKPRLRIPGDQTDPGVQTRQRGALQLGQGAYFALRNPAAHETGDLAEQEALEQLATFSVLARLIDTCQVVT